MTSIVAAGDAAPASRLQYPLQTEPEVGDGSAVAVAPGVLWLRMPLFAALPFEYLRFN
jgi:hypothetical protein